MFPFLATLIHSVLKSAYGLAGMVGYDPQRPKYEMPKSVTDAESIYQFLSGADMAGKKEAETNIFQSQANTLDMLQQGVSDSSALLNTAPQVQGQTNQALSGLAVESSKQKQQAQGTYANFLQGTKAQYEDKMWQWNEAEPYLNEAKAKEEATQNLFGGIKDIGQGAMDIFSAKQIEQLTQAEKDKIKLMGEDLKLRAGNGTTEAVKNPLINNAPLNVTEHEIGIGGFPNTLKKGFDTETAEALSRIKSAVTNSIITATNKITSNDYDNLYQMQTTGTYAPQSNVADIAKENISLSLEDYLKPEDYRTQSDIQYNEWMKNNPIKEDITNTENDINPNSNVSNLSKTPSINTPELQQNNASTIPLDKQKNADIISKGEREPNMVNNLTLKNAESITPSKKGKKKMFNGKIIETSDNADALEKLYNIDKNYKEPVNSEVIETKNIKTKEEINKIINDNFTHDDKIVSRFFREDVNSVYENKPELLRDLEDQLVNIKLFDKIIGNKKISEVYNKEYDNIEGISKLRDIVNNMKENSHKSYWKEELGDVNYRRALQFYYSYMDLNTNKDAGFLRKKIFTYKLNKK